MHNDFDEDREPVEHVNGFTRLGAGLGVVFTIGLMFLLFVCWADGKPIPWLIASALALMAALSFLSGKIIDGVFSPQD